MPTRMTTLVALALAGLGSGCGKGGSPTTSADPTTNLYLEVRNMSAYRMTISVLLSGDSTRLGQVNAGTTARFAVPKALVNVGVPVRFFAEPTVAGRMYTEEIVLSAGRTARVTIPPG